MNIKIQSRGFKLSEALYEHTHSKLYLTLGRYAERIRNIEVVLTDINGPKGGEDMRCIIKLRLNRFKSVALQETSSDMYDAINQCSHHARRVVERHFNRLRKMHRRPVHYEYA